jgi:hypothetical protein
MFLTKDLYSLYIIYKNIWWTWFFIFTIEKDGNNYCLLDLAFKVKCGGCKMVYGNIASYGNIALVVKQKHSKQAIYDLSWAFQATKHAVPNIDMSESITDVVTKIEKGREFNAVVVIGGKHRGTLGNALDIVSRYNVPVYLLTQNGGIPEHIIYKRDITELAQELFEEVQKQRAKTA